MRTRTIRAAGALGVACAVGLGAVSYAASVGTSASFVGNDVANPTAAVDLSGWQASSANSPVTLTRVAAQVPSGTTTAIDLSSGDTGDWGEVLGKLSDPAFVVPGKTYQMSVWVRDLNASGKYVGMLIANANYGDRPSQDSVYTGFRDTGWHKLTKTFVATTNVTDRTMFYVGLAPHTPAHWQIADAKLSVLSTKTTSVPVFNNSGKKTPAAAPTTQAPAPVTSTTTAPPAAAPNSSTPAAPTSTPATNTGQTTAGNVPGFKLVFNEDFNQNAAAGQFLNVYGSKWGTYNGFRDTGGVGQYSNNVISVANGVLDMYLHTENGVPQVAAPVPFINGSWGGSLYGRYSVRFRADSLPNYKTAWLLWPDSNNWSQGEIDFPEGELNSTIWAFNHQVGNPSQNAMAVGTGASFTSWHTATTEWTPAGVKFYLDGNLVGSSPVSPSAPMHMVLQTETSGSPSASVAGHVQIDSVSIWSYTG